MVSIRYEFPQLERWETKVKEERPHEDSKVSEALVVKFESMELGVEIIAKVMVGLDQRKVPGMDNSNRTRRSRAMDKDKEPSRVTCKDIPLVEPVTASSIAVVLVLGIALCKDIVVAMRVIIKCYHNLLVLQPQEGNSNHTRRNSNSICNNSNNNNSNNNNSNSTPTSTTTSSSSNNNSSSSSISNSISNSSNSICNSNFTTCTISNSRVLCSAKAYLRMWKNTSTPQLQV